MHARALVDAAIERLSVASNGAQGLTGLLMEADEEMAEAELGAGRILDVARGVEIPTFHADETAVDASEILRLAIRLMQTELRSAASLEVDVRPAPCVAGSYAQVGHVLLNLLVNAVQSMSLLPRERRTLSIRLFYEQPWVHIEFSDSGPSLAVDLLSNDFEPCRRGSSSGGLGLGLAISKTIVDELGGKLEAVNRTGGGASFRVLFPRSKPESTSIASDNHLSASEAS